MEVLLLFVALLQGELPRNSPATSTMRKGKLEVQGTGVQLRLNPHAHSSQPHLQSGAGSNLAGTGSAPGRTPLLCISCGHLRNAAAGGRKLPERAVCKHQRSPLAVCC